MLYTLTSAASCLLTGCGSAPPKLLAFVMLACVTSFSGASNDAKAIATDPPESPPAESLSPGKAQAQLLANFIRLATEPPPSKSALKAMFGLSFEGTSTGARGAFPLGSEKSYFLPGVGHTRVHITLVNGTDRSSPGTPLPVVATCLQLQEVVQLFDQNGWTRRSRIEFSHTAVKRTFHHSNYACRDVSVELSPAVVLREGAPASDAGGACMTSIEFVYRTTCATTPKN
jgi:hypothetical protein